MPAERFNDQHGRGQALLSVDHQQRRLARHLIKTLFDVNHRADEMSADFFVTARSRSPTVAGTVCIPRIGALVDGNDQLWRFLKKASSLALMLSPLNKLDCRWNWLRSF